MQARPALSAPWNRIRWAMRAVVRRCARCWRSTARTNRGRVCIPPTRLGGIPPRSWLRQCPGQALPGLAAPFSPTGVKLAATRRKPIHTIVVNARECEPYISCDDTLMRNLAAGGPGRRALALMALTGAARGCVAVERDKGEAIEALKRELAVLGDPKQLTVVTVPAIYPAGGERQLIQALTRHEVPSLAYPTDIGYLCQNVGTAAALYRFLESGEPLTRRITTVTGRGIARPRNLEVRLGTRIADVVTACGGYKSSVTRLIMGGSMMGISLESDSVPVMRATNCILLPTDRELGRDVDELPCIRCW